MNRNRILVYSTALVMLSVVSFLGYHRLSASAQSAASTPAA